ncbi:MAG: histone deacetylase [Nitrospinaceae bacterium]|nr:histone deacetylase [Nitrospinaceae bacterium]
MATFIFHPDYFADIGNHVLQAEKFHKTHKCLLKTGIPESAFAQPDEAPDKDILLVHTPEYLADMRSGQHTARTLPSELPLSPEIVRWCLLSVGGTTLAAREAMAHGFALNLSGGFHHAFPDCAEGFCYMNDLAVAVRPLQNEGAVSRAAIIDCDLHQGNGTASIFRKDESVFTFSIHQENIYPPKKRSSLDIGLADLTDDAAYMKKIQDNIPQILDKHRPEIVIYQAGADPYMDDQLGTLKLSKKGLRQRDDLILAECRKRAIPVAGTLGGGYARNSEDTVDIHVQTAFAFWEALKRAGEIAE